MHVFFDDEAWLSEVPSGTDAQVATTRLQPWGRTVTPPLCKQSETQLAEDQDREEACMPSWSLPTVEEEKACDEQRHGQWMRSTPSHSIGPDANTNIDGCTVCVRGRAREVVTVRATFLAARPTQLLTHQPWQPSGQTKICKFKVDLGVSTPLSGVIYSVGGSAAGASYAPALITGTNFPN
eukprot:3963534-Amphidinium_carterae.1